MKKALAAVIVMYLLQACSGKKSGGENPWLAPPPNVAPNVTRPVTLPSYPQPERLTIDSYCPPTKVEWGGPPCFLNLLKTDAEVADDYLKWFEAAYEAWDKTLVLGHSPKLYLSKRPSAPEAIEFIDKTNGKIGGMEKLKDVYPAMLKRCPSLAEERFKAPLTVEFVDNDYPGTSGNFHPIETQLNDYEDGSFHPVAPMLWNSSITIKGEYFKPDNTAQGWYGYKFPNQTFLEQSSGKTWAEGGSAIQAMDKTFAHEYGHFLQQAWALNMGRSTFQSFMFSEGLAELIRRTCWGDYYDNPEQVALVIKYAYNLKDPRPFGSDAEALKTQNKRVKGLNYYLQSVDDLIAWDINHGRFDRDKMFRAIFDTMEAMTGRIIKDYPAYDVLDGKRIHDLLPWSRAIDHKGILDDAPMLFTRQEFLEKFCDHYDCGELRFLIEADAEGNRKTEW